MNSSGIAEGDTGTRIALRTWKPQIKPFLLVLLFSKNHIGVWNDKPKLSTYWSSVFYLDYPIVIWATHKLGGIISWVYASFSIRHSYVIAGRGSNPEFTANEVFYQINETKATLMILHPDCYSVGLDAAKKAGLPNNRVILFDVEGKTTKEMKEEHDTIGLLIDLGTQQKQQYEQRKLADGEGKSKVAFYAFSSGTTGNPKVGIWQNHNSNSW